MIANPKLKAYKYDSYSKEFTKEYYEDDEMKLNRYKAIQEAKNCKKFGVIMGTLGRQGNPKVVDFIKRRIEYHKKECMVILLSEIFPNKLNLFNEIEAFVQIACPRLSIDWGNAFRRPLLNPYELAVALGDTKWCVEKENDAYPMDFYANDSLGMWTPNYKPKNDCMNTDKCCGKCTKG